jgi:hypothetical protein
MPSRLIEMPIAISPTRTTSGTMINNPRTTAVRFIDFDGFIANSPCDVDADAGTTGFRQSSEFPVAF